MIQRTSRIARSKPPRKRRKGVRRGPWRSEPKRRWIASRPCLITGRPAQCCHVINNGASSKGGDEWTVPLSPEFHDQFDGRAKLPNGEVGKKAFQRFYEIDLSLWSEMYHRAWLREEGNGK